MPDLDFPLYERRRYSAVAFSQSALRNYAELSAVVKGRLASPTRARNVATTWSVRRVEILDDRSHYPLGAELLARQRREGGFAHYSYVAFRAADIGQDPLIVVAAPYRRLLASFMREIESGVDGPTPQFWAVKMGPLFDHLYSEPDSFKATRITVQTSGEPGVSLVSLSGASPLQSGLWSEIRNVVTPYGARITYLGAAGSIHLHSDRVGNHFWYQLTEETFDVACHSIGYLADKNLGRSVGLSPLRRGSGKVEDEFGG